MVQKMVHKIVQRIVQQSKVPRVHWSSQYLPYAEINCFARCFVLQIMKIKWQKLMKARTT